MSFATKTAVALWIFLALFFLRVAGQLIVALWAPVFLPPMEAWYSGLLPYPLLLPTQLVILVLFFKIAWDISVGRGYWFQIGRSLGLKLLGGGIVYFLAMVVRYALQGLSIPVVFHWVLAGYIITLGWYGYTYRTR